MEGVVVVAVSTATAGQPLSPTTPALDQPRPSDSTGRGRAVCQGVGMPAPMAGESGGVALAAPWRAERALESGANEKK
jgi:hypothetical protein